jgi:hypothetical protein
VTSMRVAVLGLVALIGCVGCATGTRSLVGGSNGFASPATIDDQKEQQCEGWFDAAAGVCDTIGAD